ncbi:major facilitator transporter [Rhodococcus rhodochrous]|uniref:MFS transporter n=1 Tax=Rhodococcus TaxID=1827 RepID=UPI000750E8F2|nr:MULTISPECIES: MFS transporter [Rhodococcus]MDC3724771.1 MFS transporter [Rhodococcus sp. Rp3]MDJ0397851.1 MFS transporter [Rhodococcus rhodochrous]MDO1483718.1 MFS transporter [Rhodococcus rhodochrous]WSE22907.1 MFS transporter [Rhodococcus sp. PD04]SNV08566.1 major facilitator transporter [Rhodococcus rhodochrous]
MVQVDLQSSSSSDPELPRYRWVVLATGVFAQASAATVLQGMPSLAPALRARFGLSLAQLGMVLAASTVGLLIALVPWGALADRIGERLVMTLGLVATGGALVAAAAAPSVVGLCVALVAAGAACASVNAASGRAVLMWFSQGERGLAMGARQTAIPVGAGLAALGLPAAERAWGLGGAFLAAAVAVLTGAVAAVVFIREPRVHETAVARSGLSADPGGTRSVAWLCAVSLLLVVPQLAVVSFMVVYLVDEHAMDPATAAALLALVQFGGGALRIGLGAWSDRSGRRLPPLMVVSAVTSALFAVLAVGAWLGGPIVVPILMIAGLAGVSWNGLAFTAVGEAADPRRIGLVLGIQNTAVAAGMVLTPPVLGAVVESADWPFSFVVAGVAAATAATILAVLLRVGARPRLHL